MSGDTPAVTAVVLADNLAALESFLDRYVSACRCPEIRAAVIAARKRLRQAYRPSRHAVLVERARQLIDRGEAASEYHAAFLAGGGSARAADAIRQVLRRDRKRKTLDEVFVQQCERAHGDVVADAS